nr:radical SAM protein [uncultured Pseudoalteromonas sp.]
MDELPPLTYEDGETVYQRGKGFIPLNYNSIINYVGLSYGTIWSIGCPLHCTYCGNTKFIEYDSGYRRLRHSSPRTIVDEIKRAITKQPHLSVVSFYDDSFLALPYVQLEEFCKLYKAEIKIPFAIYGVIPTYVREDKIALLLDAGMNRVRMGIQSGSDNILEFYKRPTKLHRIKEATEILNKFDVFNQFKLPVLAGLSRKSMIGNLLNRDTNERLAGSLAGALIAAQNGAKIIRVHDVQETVDVLSVWQACTKGITNE